MRDQPPPRRDPPPQRRSYAGLTTCLRCDTLFYSWDRRQNRLCEPCRQATKAHPSDEPVHPLPKSRHRPRGADDR
jgi:hypothetical protein